MDRNLEEKNVTKRKNLKFHDNMGKKVENSLLDNHFFAKFLSIQVILIFTGG